jgi:3alpha(or 20beta)-hydroxysteroid dehydrogenase
MGRVSGKVAIVSGAARGLGEAFARLLAREGAKVVVADVRHELGQQTAKSIGENAMFMHLDVRKEDEWNKVVAATEAAFGPVTVLVNNAGILGPMAPIENIPLSEYQSAIDVIQTGVFLGMKTVLPSMRRAGVGSMINLSSTSGLRGNPNSIVYTGAKFAVRGMTKAAALEFIQYNVRVNSLHPGTFRTPMSMGDQGGNAEIDAVVQLVPTKRWGEPHEIAHMVLLLASDEMPYATGAEFVVDGGLTCR